MGENRGAAVAIAVVTVTFFALLGTLVVAFGWIGMSIYALVKAIGSAPDAGNPTVVVLFFLGLVGSFTVLFAVSLGLVGRALTPRKRKKGETEQLALDLNAERAQRTASP
jgi:hypothetical protein